MSISAVLFDLDGTFADTAPDLHAALEHVMSMEGMTVPAYETTRPAASHGSLAMLRAGFGNNVAVDRLDRLKSDFLAHYQTHLCDRTRLFDGIDELLDQLDRWEIKWGIVTNKPSIYTQPLVAGLGLDRRVSCVISGDTTHHSKPDPEPILYACRQIDVSPAQTLYVGDAERDIEAGRRAGTRTLVARFGYLSPQDRPEDWGADGTIDHPLDILGWLHQINQIAS